MRQPALLPWSPVHQPQAAARRLRLRTLPTWTVRQWARLHEDPQRRLGLPFHISLFTPVNAEMSLVGVIGLR